MKSSLTFMDMYRFIRSHLILSSWLKYLLPAKIKHKLIERRKNIVQNGDERFTWALNEIEKNRTIVDYIVCCWSFLLALTVLYVSDISSLIVAYSVAVYLILVLIWFFLLSEIGYFVMTLRFRRLIRKDPPVDRSWFN